MKKLFTFLLVFVFFSATNLIGQNLLTNGDFETGDKTGWNGYNNAIESVDVFEGSFSGKIPSNKDGSFLQILTLTPGNTYDVSFTAKWPDGTGWAEGMRVVFQSQPGKVKFDQTPLVNEADWTTVNSQITVPPGFTDVRFVMYKPKVPLCLIDNVSLMDAGPIKPAVALNYDGEIIEGAEDGEVINVPMLSDTYSAVLTPENWTFEGLPAGVTVGSVARVDDNTASITLAGNATEDYDNDLEFNLMISGDEFVNYTETVTSGMTVKFTAIDEPSPTLTMMSDGEILEDFEDGEKITVELLLDVFTDVLNPDNWSLINLPEGVEVGSFERTSDTTVVITLANNTTGDYDEDITDATLTVEAAEFATWNETLMTNTGVVFTAAFEGGEELIWEEDFNDFADGTHLLDSLISLENRFSTWGGPDSVVVMDGYAMMYGSAVDGSNNWFQYNTETLFPGTTYKFNADIRTTDGKKAFAVVLRAVENGQFKGNEIQNTEWETSTAYFSVDQERDSVLLSIYRWGVKTVQFDNMQLYRLTEPAISISDNGDITEGAEDGKVITVKVSNDTFHDMLSIDNWTLNNLPEGVSLGSVTRVDESTVELVLAGNSVVDYDEDITNLEVTASRYELVKSNKNLSSSDGVTFKAIIELPYITMSDDGELVEGAEDGEEIQVKIYLDSFVDPLNPANWSLINRPAGVSIGEIFRVDDTTVDIVLSGNATEDYDEDITNCTLTIKADECVNSELDLTIDTGVTFKAVIESSNDELFVKGLEVYPNPVDATLHVSAQKNISQIEVYTIHGKLVNSLMNLQQKLILINTDNWVSDIHLVKVIDEEGNQNTLKVISKRN